MNNRRATHRPPRTEPDSGAETESEALLGRIAAALDAEPMLDASRRSLCLMVTSNGEVTLEGEVDSLEARARALEIAQQFADVRRVVDKLVLRAPIAMSDGEMRDAFCREILGEIAFEDCRILACAEGTEDLARDPAAPRGTVIAHIDNAVITLEGEAPSLVHARLAGTIAWWVPGTRAVRNYLRVIPPEEDSDEEISDAVRVVLDKEPLVDAGQLRITTANGEVALAGTLPSSAQRDIAVRDAWYVAGVRRVVDNISVRAGAQQEGRGAIAR